MLCSHYLLVAGLVRSGRLGFCRFEGCRSDTKLCPSSNPGSHKPTKPTRHAMRMEEMLVGPPAVRVLASSRPLEPD